MSRPARAPDWDTWGDDASTLRLTVKVNGVVVDLTDDPVAEFTWNVAGVAGETPVDLTDGEDGIVYLPLTGAQVATLPKRTDWSVRENVRFDRTLAYGRINHDPGEGP